MIPSNQVSQTALITTLGAITVTLIGTFFYKKWKSNKLPTQWEEVGSLKKIHLYPLKSGRRIELDSAVVTEVGLKQPPQSSHFQLRDRCFIVYGEKDFEFRTARTYPKMVHIQVAHHRGQDVVMSGPNMNDLQVAVPDRSGGKVVQIKCWDGEKIEGLDCGDKAAEWLSQYIIERNSGLRLAYNDANHRRNIKQTHQKLLSYYKNLTNNSTGLFSDLSSVSLISLPSVKDVDSRIEDANIIVEQFRLNLTVDGAQMLPYAEDDWDWIKIGQEVVLRNVKDCTRCIFTTINPETGIRNPNRQPLKTLEKYRQHKGPESSPRLGSNLEVVTTGIINVDDTIYVVRKKDN